jgi:hypothetical protein
MHVEAYRWFDFALRSLPYQHVLEIGARSINGTIRDLCSSATSYVGIDIRPGPDVDAVASGHDYQPVIRPDLVLCAEVFEHVPDEMACAICQHALALLMPGGSLLLSMATDPRRPHSADDGGDLRPGEFYRNVTPQHLRVWLEGFAGVQWHIDAHGDLYAHAKKGTADAA